VAQDDRLLDITPALQHQITIVIADDHPAIRDGVMHQLERHADFTVVGTAATGAEVLELTQRLQPTVLLLDVRMPGTQTVKVMQQVLALPTPPYVLMFSAHDDIEQVMGLLHAGASGYALKDERADALAEAVRTVARGERWLSQAIEAKLVDHTLHTTSARTQHALTARELDVLRLIAPGYKDPEIAATLHIAPGTVKLHLARIFEKLGLCKRAQVVAWAWQHGLVEREQ
jgi:DNA-binding NarL/FixJ family response regulator